MVIRSAVGALCVVAVLGAVAMALPEHTRLKAGSGKKDPPFGGLTTTAFVDPKKDGDRQIASTAAETAKLLKLATLPEAQSPPKIQSPAPPRVQPPTPAASVPTPAAATAPAALAAALQRPAAPDLDKAEAPVLAMADPELPARSVPAPLAPTPTPPRGKEKSGVVDINRASEDALDHLPGGGRIGRSIVRHRPYRTIEDLVHKRVLRLSAFQRIQGSIKVD